MTRLMTCDHVVSSGGRLAYISLRFLTMPPINRSGVLERRATRAISRRRDPSASGALVVQWTILPTGRTIVSISKYLPALQNKVDPSG